MADPTTNVIRFPFGFDAVPEVKTMSPGRRRKLMRKQLTMLGAAIPCAIELLGKDQSEIVALMGDSSESAEAWVAEFGRAANRALDIAELLAAARDRIALALNIPVPAHDDDGDDDAA
jgi:hypothetical protein